MVFTSPHGIRYDDFTSWPETNVPLPQAPGGLRMPQSPAGLRITGVLRGIRLSLWGLRLFLIIHHEISSLSLYVVDRHHNTIVITNTQPNSHALHMFICLCLNRRHGLHRCRSIINHVYRIAFRAHEVVHIPALLRSGRQSLPLAGPNVSVGDFQNSLAPEAVDLTPACFIWPTLFNYQHIYSYLLSFSPLSGPP